MSIIPKPSWAKPSDLWVNQAEKFAPVVNLPDGRILAPWQKRNDITPESIIGRLGVVAIGNYSAPANIRHGFHHSVDLVQFMANKTPGRADLWTREEVRSAASAYSLMPCEGNDFGEGTWSFQPGTQQALWWYERRRELYASAQSNPNGIVRRDYGHHGCTISYQGTNHQWTNNSGGTVRPDDPFFRNAYGSVAAAKSGVEYFSAGINGIAYPDLVGCNIKSYAETPDYARTFYSKLYAIQRMGKGMGKVGGIGPGFLVYNDWAKIEGIGDPDNSNPSTVNNGLNFSRRIVSPAGYAVTSMHPMVDYDWQVGCYLIIGFCYGDGVSTFEVPNRSGTDASKMELLNTPGVPAGNDKSQYVGWQPDVAGTTAPAIQDGYPTEFNRWHDAAYEAAYYYAQFSRTAGVGWQPLAYRFEGSDTWITPPPDGASVLEHASAFDTVNANGQNVRRGRPVAEGRVKDNAFDFVAFDASRSKANSERIYVKCPGSDQQFPSLLRGCIPNVHTETIS